MIVAFGPKDSNAAGFSALYLETGDARFVLVRRGVSRPTHALHA
jgi:hypothetical protein